MVGTRSMKRKRQGRQVVKRRKKELVVKRKKKELAVKRRKKELAVKQRKKQLPQPLTVRRVRRKTMQSRDVLHCGQHDDSPAYLSIPVNSDVVSLLNEAAFPVSAEFEYMFASSIGPEVVDPVAKECLAVDQKCWERTAHRLRERIATKNLVRRMHKNEKYGQPGLLDLSLHLQYLDLVTTQCGQPVFPTKPDASWAKLNKNVYIDDTTEAIHCRRPTTQEFAIRFPKIAVPVELVTTDVLQSITAKRDVAACVPTVSNPTFRRIYEQAVRNAELEPEPVTPVSTPVEPLPITSFSEADKANNKIAEAIRLAKEKMAAKVKRPRPIPRPRGTCQPKPPPKPVPTKPSHDDKTKSVVPNPINGPLSEPFFDWNQSITAFVGESPVDAARLSQYTKNGLHYPKQSENKNNDKVIHVPMTVVPDLHLPPTYQGCNLSDDEEDDVPNGPPPQPVTKTIPPLEPKCVKFPSVPLYFSELDDDADILRLDIDENMDWLS